MVFDHAGQRRGRRPARARQIFPRAGLGRARPDRDLGEHPRGHRRRARQGQPRRHATSRPSASPTSARRPWSGTGATGRAGPQRDRLAGHPHAGDLRRAGRATAASDRFKDVTGLPLATYFAGPKVALDPRPRRRAPASAPRPASCSSAPSTPGCCGTSPAAPATAASTSPTSRTPRRTLLMDLAHARLGRGDRRGDRRSRSRCCPRSARRPRSTATCKPGILIGVPIAGILGDQQAATFGQACFERARPRTPTAPATSCCSTPATEIVASTARPAHDGLLPARRRERRSTRSRARSPSPGRSCSGCATTSASSTTPTEIEALAAHGRGQRRRLLRAGVLRPLRAALAPRRARRDRRPHPLRQQGPHRPGGAGGHGVPDPRGARRDGRRLRACRSPSCGSTAA